jgi:tetratricopeptide (TPR) repeat protein
MIDHRNSDTHKNSWSGIGDILSLYDEGKYLICIYKCIKKLSEVTEQSSPEVWAWLLNILAHAMVQIVTLRQTTRGQKQVYKRISAIFKKLYKHYYKKGEREHAAEALSNLGTAYLLRARSGSWRCYVLAHHCYREALKIYTPEQQPQEWGLIHSNVATLLLEQQGQGLATKWEEAIKHYLCVLQVEEYISDCRLLALIYNNLAILYLERAEGEQKMNQEQALQYARKAALLISRSLSPQVWAKVQYTLGLIYTRRCLGDKKQNCEFAIQHFREVLKMYNFFRSFPEWVSCQLHLASLYRQYRNKDVDNLCYAAHLYKEALHALEGSKDKTQEQLECYWGLGSIYSHRLLRGKPGHLQRALYYLAKILLHPLSEWPELWYFAYLRLKWLCHISGMDEEEIMKKYQLPTVDLSLSSSELKDRLSAIKKLEEERQHIESSILMLESELREKQK